MWLNFQWIKTHFNSKIGYSQLKKPWLSFIGKLSNTLTSVKLEKLCKGHTVKLGMGARNNKVKFSWEIQQLISLGKMRTETSSGGISLQSCLDRKSFTGDGGTPRGGDVSSLWGAVWLISGHCAGLRREEEAHSQKLGVGLSPGGPGSASWLCLWLMRRVSKKGGACFLV